MSNDLHALTVAETLNLYRKKHLSPVDMTRHALKAAEKYAHLNAFAALDASAALRAARASEKRWLSGNPRALDGITVTIKDFYDVRGYKTRTGSRTTADDIKKSDSVPVARLRDAGAVLIGKTTLPEFGHKGVTDSPLHGITRNPHHPKKTCGGSSGGAAVAASVGAGQLHLGSDAGGSIRIPASFCGVFGFKPTPGVVPSWPQSLFSSLSSAGPLTRSVGDAAMMMDALAIPHPRDPQGVAWKTPFYKGLSQKLPKLKIAFAGSIDGQTMTPLVSRVIRDRLREMGSLGVIDDITIDCVGIVDTFNKHWMAVASLMARDIPAAQKKKMDPRFLHWARRGDNLHLHDYLRAQQQRMEIASYFKALLDEYDILLMPSTAMTAFDVGSNMPRDAKGKLWDDWTPFTYPANLARLPAASIPPGFDKDGLPVGLQVVAGSMKDNLVLNVCHRIESLLHR
jgi:aspartyl-tRNA(Asn)/glutamyl-tRNA(Gln) amidotransferase subunit A